MFIHTCVHMYTQPHFHLLTLPATIHLSIHPVIKPTNYRTSHQATHSSIHPLTRPSKQPFIQLLTHSSTHLSIHSSISPTHSSHTHLPIIHSPSTIHFSIHLPLHHPTPPIIRPLRQRCCYLLSKGRSQIPTSTVSRNADSSRVHLVLV